MPTYDKLALVQMEANVSPSGESLPEQSTGLDGSRLGFPFRARLVILLTGRAHQLSLDSAFDSSYCSVHVAGGCQEHIRGSKLGNPRPSAKRVTLEGISR